MFHNGMHRQYLCKWKQMPDFIYCTVLHLTLKQSKKELRNLDGRRNSLVVSCGFNKIPKVWNNTTKQFHVTDFDMKLV